MADPVFPHTPNRATFAKDRAAAGVPELDGRQRPVGFHSLRRGFASLLYAAKAPEATMCSGCVQASPYFSMTLRGTTRKN